MNDKIRVLHFVTSLNTGGIETWLNNVTKHLDWNEYHFDFISFSTKKGIYDNEIASRGGRIYYLKSHKDFFINYKFLRRLIIDNRYDILHCHLYKYNAIYAVMNIFFQKKMVSHSHNLGYDTQMISIDAGVNKIYKWIQNKLSHLCLGCSKLATIALFYRIDSKRQVLYYGIETDKFEPGDLYNLLPTLKDKIILGHVGRFVDVKNHSFIIDIAKKLAVINKNNYHFVFIGDGELKTHISDLIIQNSLQDYITIIAATPDVYQYFSTVFDVLLLPSKKEGFGIVAIEAQAAGLEVLASTEVPDEIKVNENVYFLPLEINEWVQNITRIKKKASIEDRKAFYNNFRQSKFSIGESTTNIQTLYKKLLNDH